MVASDMALEIIADVSVVWLLSTKANFKPQAKGKLARAFAALPAHAFQVPHASRLVDKPDSMQYMPCLIACRQCDHARETSLQAALACHSRLSCLALPAACISCHVLEVIIADLC